MINIYKFQNSPHKSTEIFSNNERFIWVKSLKVKFKYRTLTVVGQSKKFSFESLLQDKSKYDSFKFSNASYWICSIELLPSFNDISRSSLRKILDSKCDRWLLLRSRYCKFPASLNVVLSINLISLWLALSTWQG